VRVINSLFQGNDSHQGGGLYVNTGQAESPTVTVLNCQFVGNGTGGYGGAAMIVATGTTFNNCLMNANTAGVWGGALYLVGNFALKNCTLVHNEAENGGGIIAFGTGSTTVHNSIFFDNTQTTFTSMEEGS
jgi:hypothetical protein